MKKRPGLVDKLSILSFKRAIENCQKNNGVTPLTIYTPEEMNYMLGGKGCEFIPAKKYNPDHDILKYNESIPYYTYGEAVVISHNDYCPERDDRNFLN